MIRVIRIIHQHLHLQRNKKEKNKDSTPYLDLNTVEYVCESYLLYDSCICQFMEGRNPQHHAYC